MMLEVSPRRTIRAGRRSGNRGKIVREVVNVRLRQVPRYIAHNFIIRADTGFEVPQLLGEITGVLGLEPRDGIGHRVMTESARRDATEREPGLDNSPGARCVISRMPRRRRSRKPTEIASGQLKRAVREISYTAHLSTVIGARSGMKIPQLFFDIGEFLAGKLGKMRSRAYAVNAVAIAASLPRSVWRIDDRIGDCALEGREEHENGEETYACNENTRHSAVLLLESLEAFRADFGETGFFYANERIVG